jgi:hypothetical protein
MKSIKQLVRDRKGVGLVYLWVGVAFTLVVLYLMFSFLLPVLAQVDNTMYGYMVGTNMNISQPWINTWTDNGVWILHDATYWFFFGLMAAIIIAGIIISARREPNETYYDY